MHNKKCSKWITLVLRIIAFGAFLRNGAIIFLISLTRIKTKVSFARVYKNTFWHYGRKSGYYSSLFFDVFNRFNRLLKIKAASSRALSEIYNFDYEHNRSRDGVKAYLVSKSNSARAVANRKQVIVFQLIALLKKFDKTEINIVSFASGSAEAVIEAIAAVKGEKKVLVTLVDSDEESLREAGRLAEAAGILENFTFSNKKILYAINDFFHKEVDIVEMAGFLDYLKDDTAEGIFRRIREKIAPRYLITCNIIPNSERIFMDYVLMWPMVYRRPDQFNQLLVNAGFEKNEIHIEPLGLHLVVVSER